MPSPCDARARLRERFSCGQPGKASPTAPPRRAPRPRPRRSAHRKAAVRSIRPSRSVARPALLFRSAARFDTSGAPTDSEALGSPVWACGVTVPPVRVVPLQLMPVQRLRTRWRRRSGVAPARAGGPRPGRRSVRRPGAARLGSTTGHQLPTPTRRTSLRRRHHLLELRLRTVPQRSRRQIGCPPPRGSQARSWVPSQSGKFGCLPATRRRYQRFGYSTEQHTWSGYPSSR